MQLTEADARARFAAGRVLRLATAGADAVPHLVPATFALVDDVLVIAVDHKPKRHQNLKRLRNIAENSQVSALVDDYADDWTQLWWARADGTARILDGADREPSLDRLAEKYPQYRALRPDGPVIAIDVAGWSGWAYR